MDTMTTDTTATNRFERYTRGIQRLHRMTPALQDALDATVKSVLTLDEAQARAIVATTLRAAYLASSPTARKAYYEDGHALTTATRLEADRLLRKARGQ